MGRENRKEIGHLVSAEAMPGSRLILPSRSGAEKKDGKIKVYPKKLLKKKDRPSGLPEWRTGGIGQFGGWLGLVVAKSAGGSDQIPRHPTMSLQINRIAN